LFSAKFSSIQFLGNESKNWASVTLELYLAKNQKSEKMGPRNNREAENSQFPWARNPIVFSPVRA